MADATGADQTMTDALRSNHAAISAMLREPRCTADSDDGLAHREELVMTMVRHFVAEEQYLYPAVREHVGDEPATTGLHADRAIERQLRALEDDDLDADRLAEIVAGLTAEFETHVARQEPLLAELDRQCPRDALLEAGEGVIGAEQLAPTSPRRIAPTSPTANKLLSVVTGWVDQVRDHYTHRGTPADDR